MSLIIEVPCLGIPTSYDIHKLIAAIWTGRSFTARNLNKLNTRRGHEDSTARYSTVCSMKINICCLLVKLVELELIEFEL